MNTLLHPSVVLKQEWVNIIRDNAHYAAAAGWLTIAQLQLAHEQGWFKLLAPACYGGRELSLPDAVKLEEAIAYADGSMGWVVTLCAGAAWFGGFINPQQAHVIFKEPNVCIAGSGSISGTAEINDDGYVLNGIWQYASGAPGATAFTANCYITQNGQQLKDKDNEPLVRPFILLKEEVTILPTWNKMGMTATASHSFSVSDLQVHARRAFDIDTTAPVIDNPLYHYPFLQLAEVTLATNICGMALHFIALCEDLFGKKKGRQGKLLIDIKEVAIAVQEANRQMHDARLTFYDTLHASWQACEMGEIDAALLHDISHSAHALVTTARNSVNALYPYGGLYAAEHSNELNRVWRDIHTAAQHPLLVFADGS